jgi:nucleotide-binding universal stress UspA family protein
MTSIETIEPVEVPEATPLDELHVRRLLVAVDGSSTAELAIRAAVTAGHTDHAAITLLVVVPDMVTETTRWPMAGAPDPAQLQREADEEARRLLAEVVDRLPEDLPVKTLIRHGRPGPEICAQAKACGDYDAILLGARGVGRVGALTGSVSTYVLHHADTTVIVVHPPRGERA